MYWLTQKLVDVPENDDWLTHNEIICMSKLRFPKRRAEWRLGRWTAKRALLKVVPAPCGRLSEFLGPILNNAPQGGGTTNNYFSQIEIRAAADGAPEAFVQNQPAPLTISLSHRDEIGFCAINPFHLAVGCDVEKVEPRSANFVADYFTAEEEKLVSQAPEQDRHWLATLVWSAKESALKALRQGLRLDTRSVLVDVAQAAPVAAGQAEKGCHSERIFFESESVAGNEKDCHENAVAQASSLQADRMSALHFHHYGCANVHGHSSGMTKSFTEHLLPTEWNHLTAHYQATARTLHGWWRIDGKFVQTIVAEPFMEPPIKLISLEKQKFFQRIEKPN
jgi:4'-phosphopantetheinyl transferase